MRSLTTTLLAAFILCANPATAGTSGPALWKVSDADTNIHILGSVHVLKPGTVWLHDDLQRKLGSAKVIYLEISAADQQPQAMQPLVAKYGLLPEGDALKAHVPEAVYATLSAEFKDLGLPEPAFARFKPWMAGTVYEAFKFAKLGFNPAAGVEATVVSLAQAKGVPIEGLETGEFQIRMLDSFSEGDAVDMLREALAEKDKLPGVMARLTTSWTQGDTADLAAYFKESIGANTAVEKKLLTDRNAEWAPKITAMLEKPGDYVLVVGVAHLVGEKSVLSMLEKQGMKVERVE